MNIQVIEVSVYLRQGPALAVLSTFFACLIIFIQTCIDAGDDIQYLQHSNPTVASFALGFSCLLYTSDAADE